MELRERLAVVVTALDREEMDRGTAIDAILALVAEDRRELVDALRASRGAIAETPCYPAIKQYVGSIVKDHLDGALCVADAALAKEGEQGIEHASCDCIKYNGGQCYNCLNGAHDICDGGQGRCSRTKAERSTP